MSRRFILIVALAGVVFLAGCSTLDSTASRRQLYVDQHPELSDLFAESILNERIQVGMNAEMVQASWGKPGRIESRTDEGLKSLWIYGNVFVGGTITNLFFDHDDVLVRYEVLDQGTHANQGSLKAPDREMLGPSSNSAGELSKGTGGP